MQLRKKFNKNLFLLLLFITSNAVFAQTSTVFTSGTEGHTFYRIPAIVALPDGKLLAFAEGRVDSGKDYGDVNIVLKTSTDGGRTWTPVSIIVDYGKKQAGNAAPVVDLLDPQFPKGRVFLFYNTGTSNEKDLREGKGVRETWYKTSVDGGQTWSEAVNITSSVHKPNEPEFNPAYVAPEDWRVSANTPGHAMQFSQGKFKGRLYVAGYHSEGAPKANAEEYAAHGFYSDDHGKTFKLSDNIPLPGSNEATAAELTDGHLIFNARNQRRDVKARIVAYSADGGQVWDTAYIDKNLPDPVCQASILNIGFKRGKAILAFCNAADTMKRDNLTLRISYDHGKTWAISKTIDNKLAEGKRDNAAYSDMVKMGKSKIGVLYEKDYYSKILFTVVDWKKK
ncbi:sialidase family protein [Pedobacter sp.]